MKSPHFARLFGVVAASWLTLSSSAAHADSYVVIEDDGQFTSSTKIGPAMATQLYNRYLQEGGAPVEVLSVWTTFPMNGNIIETRFGPFANDVKGIGLETVYGGDGTFASSLPPLRAMLLHNNVLKLPERAAFQNAPVEGYAAYLFLLELSHLWGPAAQLFGGSPGALIGFPFHWSFFFSTGGAAAGGSPWIDNGDGTFQTAPLAPKDVKFSMLDLYLMGLATADEVPDSVLLENVEVLSAEPDPFTKKAPSPTTFPWFGTNPVVVKASPRTVTIDEIIQANGTREPAAAQAQKSWDLGIVLYVHQGATEEELAAAKAAMAPVADSLAPAFQTATQGRGTLEVLTQSGGGAGGADAGSAGAAGGLPVADAGPEAGGAAGSGGAPAAPPPSGGSDSGGGCSVSAPAPTPWWSALFAGLALGLGRRRKLRAPRAQMHGATSSTRAPASHFGIRAAGGGGLRCNPRPTRTRAASR
jgi:hypothetical protein